LKRGESLISLCIINVYYSIVGGFVNIYLIQSP
jgi:hypothetical protein